MTTDQRNTHRNEFVKRNKRFEGKYFPKVHNAIKSKISSLISVIRDKGIDAAHSYIQTDLTNAELSNVVNGLYKEVGLRYARQEYRRQRQDIRAIGFPKKKSISQTEFEAKAAFGFNDSWTAFILQYLQQFLIEKITFDVNETTRNALLDVLQEGIAEGWSIDEFVKHLEDLPFTAVQAARITRTETNRAANVGTMAGVDTAEYEMNKEWISAHDSRTRGVNPKDHASHIDLDGQVIEFDQTFTDRRNGDVLRFPGDPKASAASTINCRCSIAPVPKRDSNGFLVPKPQPAVSASVHRIYKPAIAASPQVGLQVGK